MIYGDTIGARAAIDNKSRQVRKEAAVVVDSGAAMWLIAVTTLLMQAKEDEMSYIVLARKYRPRTFSEMTGQEHVLLALQHAITNGRLHHAYLFTGTRGVGKTTIARIFAKCLNCEQGMTITPCERCSTCQEINQGRYVDLIEIDAASRTKVEDTREILDNVQYMPQRGRYKIYLIDEVHMLSGHSFNALLKTLEEPPGHVKFLLATTDPQRLPDTVLSRCLQFHLKSLSLQQIIHQMEIILKQEQITYEGTALSSLALAAKGSMRDALSLLDQCIAYGNGQVQETTTDTMLGLVSERKVIALLACLTERDASGMLAQIEALETLGADFFTVLDDILALLQKIAVAHLIDTASENIQSLTKNISPEDLQLYYQIGLMGKRDLLLAPDAKVGFTMTMIRMLAFTPQFSTTTSKESKELPQKTVPAAAAKPVAQLKDTSVTTHHHRSAEVQSTTSSQQGDPWMQILTQLNLSGAAQLLAKNCTLTSITPELVTLAVDESYAALLNPMTQERLNKALQDHLGNACKLMVTVGKSITSTPAQLETQKKIATKKAAHEQMLQDPNVQQMMKTFSATLQADTLVPKEPTT